MVNWATSLSMRVIRQPLLNKSKKRRRSKGSTHPHGDRLFRKQRAKKHPTCRRR